MNKILFTGDSITKGRLGCSFYDMLAPEFPSSQFVNLGQDGDTLRGIMDRTLAHLYKDRNYSLIVIEAGHNDIILPDFQKKSAIHRSIVRKQIKKGSHPASGFSDFLSTYSLFIRSLRNMTPAPIIVTTISCLGENLSSPVNQMREIYNEGIRTLADKESFLLADISRGFNDILKMYNCQDYFMDNLFESFLADARKCRTIKGADKLSEKRFLHLTIDGIHLNSRGAEIYRSILSEILYDQVMVNK